MLYAAGFNHSLLSCLLRLKSSWLFSYSSYRSSSTSLITLAAFLCTVPISITSVSQILEEQRCIQHSRHRCTMKFFSSRQHSLCSLLFSSNSWQSVVYYMATEHCADILPERYGITSTFVIIIFFFLSSNSQPQANHYVYKLGLLYPTHIHLNWFVLKVICLYCTFIHCSKVLPFLHR